MSAVREPLINPEANDEEFDAQLLGLMTTPEPRFAAPVMRRVYLRFALRLVPLLLLFAVVATGAVVVALDVWAPERLTLP